MSKCDACENQFWWQSKNPNSPLTKNEERLLRNVQSMHRYLDARTDMEEVADLLKKRKISYPMVSLKKKRGSKTKILEFQFVFE